MKRRILGLLLAAAMMGGTAFGQQPSSGAGESRKYRKVLTVAGAGGGFAAGVFAGLSLFDDAINSDRKVWTTAILGSAAGGVGGYFLGRTLDRRKAKTSALTIPLGNKTLGISPIASDGATGLRFAVEF